MTITLFEASVLTYKQSLTAVSGYLKKGKTHCEENSISLDEVVATRLYPDMLPFHFQLVSVAHHSQGALNALKSGQFGPPGAGPDLDFSGLQQLVDDALAEVNAQTPDAINALAGNTVEFKIGGNAMPFSAEDFVLTFSLPNLYFHAATAYDILRMQGVPVGKRDFMGVPRMKT